ncbi:GUN4 domain-containing protein [Nostoc sp. 'Peltigera membranacea cyanobiont' 232]|uniref:GUN4 domain-containing protein n=1 Tax=Nostoc sp. 'Peltigera membranacea cyanobiont' 232 TaxID=2014531 RepID=UPI003FA57DCB
MKNFNCKDLKQLDTLWVKNSNGYFGYSVQKKIYLASGNSLDFDWEKGEWKNRNEKGYNDFTKSVGWKGKDGEWRRYEELPMNLKEETYGGMRGRSSYGELPFYYVYIVRDKSGSGWVFTPLFLQRLVNCSR